MQLILLKVRLIILLCDRRTKQRFVMSKSFQMKKVYQRINCLVMDMQFNTTKRSLNQECMYGSSRRKRHEEYQSMVKDKVEEAEWKYSDVN